MGVSRRSNCESTGWVWSIAREREVWVQRYDEGLCGPCFLRRPRVYRVGIRELVDPMIGLVLAIFLGLDIRRTEMLSPLAGTFAASTVGIADPSLQSFVVLQATRSHLLNVSSSDGCFKDVF